MFIKIGLKKTILFLGLVMLSLSSVLFLAHGYALDEFIDDYENENYVADKYQIVRNTTYNAMELQYETAQIDETVWMPLQLREHDIYVSYNPVITFSIQGAEEVRSFSNQAGLGSAYQFFIADRTWLDGKYLRWQWDGYIAHSGEKTVWHIFIYDGEYNRANDTHFPNNAGIIIMGSGLLQTAGSETENYGWGPYTREALLDLSSGVLDNCTVFFRTQDAWAGNVYVQGDWRWVEINTGAGGSGNLWREDFNRTGIAKIMERTGTVGDYGYVNDTIGFLSEEGGYNHTGLFYTTETLSAINGSTVVLLTNSTLDGAITVEFSSNNSTWLNHNGAVGSDNLIAGYESIDLRDLNYSTLYMRYNFSRGGINLTPRLYQIRVISSAEAIGNGNGVTGPFFNMLVWFVVFPPLILFIALVYRRRGRR